MHFSGNSSMRRRSLLAAALLAAATLATATARAQAPDKPDKLPEPVEVTLPTADGAQLQTTYYPAERKHGKDAAAVILLHASGGNRADFNKLAVALQRAGCAVIAPDLRGHGGSTAIDGALRPDDYAAMVRFDVEAVKGFDQP